MNKKLYVDTNIIIFLSYIIDCKNLNDATEELFKHEDFHFEATEAKELYDL